jgi:putative membrane protein
MKTISSRLMGATLLLLSAAACEDDDDNDSTTDENSAEKSDAGRTNSDGGGSSSDAGGSDAGGSDAGASDGGASTEGDAGADASSGDAASAELTDPQIAAVTSVANDGEVLQANTARPKLTNPSAQGFADMMVTMHTAAQARQSALLMQKGITPEANAVSAMLKQESDAIVAQLSAAPAPVDLAYMSAQVTVHQKVLNTLDTVLIPSADDPALKADLMTTRGEVSAHLNMATSIRDQLAASGDGGT